jgi:crotonobetainyl-CoA:carnitine CoA-transferase CaiB-like acyl-CoA transferase
MKDNAGRVVHEAEIDKALAKWCLNNKAKTIIDTLEAERVPVGPIYNVEDMMNDAHYQARGMFEQVEIDGKPLKIQSLLPKLKSTPGETT